VANACRGGLSGTAASGRDLTKHAEAGAFDGPVTTQ